MSANHHPSEATEPIGNFDINKIAEHLSVHRSTVERLLHGGEFGKDWWRIGSSSGHCGGQGTPALQPFLAFQRAAKLRAKADWTF